MNQLGTAIKMFRAKKGYEAKELAAKANVNDKYYYKIERNENNASIRILARIAAALEVPLSEIIKLAEELEKEGE